MEQEKPEPTKGFDAEGNAVLITEEETEAGKAQHVEPDPEAAKSADDAEADENASKKASGTESTSGNDW